MKYHIGQEALYRGAPVLVKSKRVILGERFYFVDGAYCDGQFVHALVHENDLETKGPSPVEEDAK